MCYFKNPTNAPTEYTATVTKPSNTNAVKYAYAFSVSKFRFQNVDYSTIVGNTSDGIYIFRNSTSDLFLTNNGGNIIQNNKTTGLSQLWLLNNDKLTSVATSQNKLSVGNSLGNNYYRAVVNSTGADITMTPAISTVNGITNYLGTYRIITGSNYYALGIYNQSTSSGATAAWKSSSASDNTQKWYLERAAYQRGDVNMNGYINATDKTLLYNYLNGTATLTDTRLFLADIDGNGVVNSTDYNLISNCFTQ